MIFFVFHTELTGNTNCRRRVRSEQAALFLHRLCGVLELRERVRPFRAESFSLHRSGGIRRLRTAGACRARGGGECADAARAHKRVDTCGFHPLVNHPFPLDSLAKIGERRPLRNRGTAEDFFYCVFLNLFAASDTVLLHMRLNFRRRGMTVPRNSLARCDRQGLRG